MNRINNQTSRFSVLIAAFPKTIPIMAGFLFLGMSYGILARTSGLSAYVPILTSIIVFGGSLEFVGITLLTSTFSPVSAFLIGLMVQARHLFYGVSMLDKYKNMGTKKPYLVFGLCDETFSINYSSKIPDDIDRGKFYFLVTLLNHSYWVVGVTLGSLIGGAIHLNTEGLDFAMTAMFAVILLEQFLKEKRHHTLSIGLASSVTCLLLFGADSFLIPTMITITALLFIFRTTIEKRGGLE